MSLIELKTKQYLNKVKSNRKDFENFDYSKTVYIASNKKIIITCKIHGDFEQLASNHLRGYSCNKCAEEYKKEKIKNQKSIEWFKTVEIVHTNNYTYEKTIYKHSEDYVIVTCKIHGDFEIQAHNHLAGVGCKKCSIDSKKSNTIDFINKSIIVHNNKNYDYSNVDYTGTKNVVKIYCTNTDSNNIQHGEFIQNANNHLNQGKGCPKCAKKYGKIESEIFNYLVSLGIENISLNNRQILNGKELDIYIPDYKIAIEYNGLYWHSDQFKPDNYHIQKTIDCRNQGIQLIHIFEDEWINKSNIVKSRLSNILLKTPITIYARKTKFIQLTTEITKRFLIDNHIQGNTNSIINIGLAVYNPETYKYQLVSVMTFGKPRINLGNKQPGINDYELVRFCNKLNTTVIGGASKLLKYFINKYSPENIISYADLRWSQGKLYETLGFELSHESKPNYFYVDKLSRLNRFNYRKDILVSKHGCLINDTERNFTKTSLGLNRIYDCGTRVYILKPKPKILPYVCNS